MGTFIFAHNTCQEFSSLFARLYIDNSTLTRNFIPFRLFFDGTFL